MGYNRQKTNTAHVGGKRLIFYSLIQVIEFSASKVGDTGDARRLLCSVAAAVQTKENHR